MRPGEIRLALAILAVAAGIPLTVADAPAASSSFAVGPQYDTTHVYVAPEELDRFVESLIATFGGTKSQAGVINITPTPSETMWQAVFTPVGTFSVFGFKTPIPYPFGIERTGYLVSDFDAAIDSAKANQADIVVAPLKEAVPNLSRVAYQECRPAPSSATTIQSKQLHARSSISRTVSRLRTIVPQTEL
jgi:hypothetical protein